MLRKRIQILTSFGAVVGGFLCGGQLERWRVKNGFKFNLFPGFTSYKIHAEESESEEKKDEVNLPTKKKRKTEDAIKYSNKPESPQSLNPVISSDGRPTSPGVKYFETLNIPLMPEDVTYITKDNILIAYDHKTKVARWVLEHLPDKLKTKKKTDFLNPEPTIEEDSAIKDKKYKSSVKDLEDDDDEKGVEDVSYSGGQLAAANNHQYDEKTYSETFKLTNIVVQVEELKSGLWKDLEDHVINDLFPAFNDIYICSGPLYLPNESSKKFVEYRVIGENKVAVATHFFKVVVAVNNWRRRTKVECFIIPNTIPKEGVKFSEYLVSLSDLQRKSGIILFDKLRKKKPLSKSKD